jgi:hypothetical protein
LSLATYLAAALFGVGTVTTAAAATPEPPHDVIVLLDYTGSMIGQGVGNPKNIWDEVRARIRQQIGFFGDGTNLAIVPFDSDARRKLIWPQHSRGDEPISLATLSDETRASAVAYVDSLPPPDGQHTGICTSLGYALDRLRDWRTQQSGGQPDEQRLQYVYLYTDGIDTTTCASDFASKFVEVFKGHKADYPHLFGVYIDLNGVVSGPDVTTIQAGSGGDFQVDPGQPRFVDLGVSTRSLGNLYGQLSVPITLHIANAEDIPSDSVWTAAVDTSEDSFISVDPPEVALDGDIPLTLRPIRPTAGQHAGLLRLVRLGGNYIFTNGGSVPFTYEWSPPLSTTPSPAPPDVASPQPPAAVTPSSQPPAVVVSPAPPSAPFDPTWLVGSLIGALVAAFLVFLWIRTPRFPAAAAFDIAGDSHPLRQSAGVAFLRPQRLTVSGADSPFAIGLEANETTEARAIRGSESITFDPMGSDVLIDGRKVSDPTQITYGARVVGQGWTVHYRRVEDPDGERGAGA